MRVAPNVNISSEQREELEKLARGRRVSGPFRTPSAGRSRPVHFRSGLAAVVRTPRKDSRPTPADGSQVAGPAPPGNPPLPPRRTRVGWRGTRSRPCPCPPI